MARFRIALIENQQWVFSGFRGAFSGDIEVTEVPHLTECVEPPTANLYLVGNSRDDPSFALGIIRQLRETRPSALIFVLAWVSSEQLAVAALKAGVADYFSPPLILADVTASVRRILPHANETRRDAMQDVLEDRGRPIIGDSAVMRSLRERLLSIARRDSNVLLLGETGTGKDLVAEAIHVNSARRCRPFVALNCAAIPDTLLESELFGHERGAFTGANIATDGRIREARDGTIFFDEIGEMTAYAQAKMLRVIEGGQVQRLGGKGSVAVNVRIVAATNQDLLKLVGEQRFRKDLYYRLNVAQLHLPPLRERVEDIPQILDYYLGVFNRQTGSAVEGFTEQAMEWLVRYSWPGNIRELKNLVESVFVDPPRRVDLCHLLNPGSCVQAEGRMEDERDQLLSALQSTQWNKSKAAEKLRWSRMKIYRKLAKYKIDDQGCSVAS